MPEPARARLRPPAPARARTAGRRRSVTARTFTRPRGTTAADRRRVTQELRALAHPLRLRLLECFAQGPRTTMQVAADLGEPPTRLYHHVNALERSGLLKLRSTRPIRGTTEKYYEVARAQVGVEDPRQLRGGASRVARGVAAQVLEEARRELLAAMSHGGTELPLAARVVFSVSPHRQATLRRRLVRALREIAREFGSSRAPESHAWALTFVLAPTLASAASRSGSRRPRART
jgi:DNA-binding transcriptional ArsR family regulator